MAIYGYAYKTCDCEDFPCCGHNDVDPGWEPDPYDAYEVDYDDGDDACQYCDDGIATNVIDGEYMCDTCVRDCMQGA